MRLEERRLVADRGEIEDHQVRSHSLADEPAILQPMIVAGSDVDERIAASIEMAPRSIA